MKRAVVILIMFVCFISHRIYPNNIVNSYALDFSRDGRISFLVDSRKYFSVGLPFAGFFRLEAGYPWSWFGFEYESPFPFPSLYSNFGVDLTDPTKNFGGNLGIRYGVENWYFKSGLKFNFAEFEEGKGWTEVGRFYYSTTLGLNVNEFEVKLSFLYHFLSALRDENGSFNYNFPSPVSSDILSMNELEIMMDYTVFVNEVVNMKLGAGYKIEFAWSNLLSEALYRPENFYVFIRFGVAGNVFQ